MLIILGDVGLNFEKTKENKEFTEYFLSARKNIAFIDGNHENFEYLNSLPEEELNAPIEELDNEMRERENILDNNYLFSHLVLNIINYV